MFNASIGKRRISPLETLCVCYIGLIITNGSSVSRDIGSVVFEMLIGTMPD